MDWIRSRHDLDNEPELIGVTAGMLWLVGALAASVAQLVPGVDPVNPWVFFAIAISLIVYGVSSIVGWIDWSKWTVARHAWAAALFTPVLIVVLALTGGAESHLQPLLVLPLLHGAYFFSTRISALLAVELLLIAATPVLYEEHTSAVSAARLIAFAAIGLVVTVWLRLLKGRLVAAEAHQRQMATLDALTGLANRRGFDEALQAAVAADGDAARGRRAADARPGCALVIFDLNRFKLVNDTYGHPAGDRLLRVVAATCAGRIRPGDTLARIGGDEFAVVAPGAGESGAARLAEELHEAAMLAGAEATVAWAVHPADGGDPDALLRIADRRLYDRKAALTHA